MCIQVCTNVSRRKISFPLNNWFIFRHVFYISFSSCVCDVYIISVFVCALYYRSLILKVYFKCPKPAITLTPQKKKKKKKKERKKERKTATIQFGSIQLKWNCSLGLLLFMLASGDMSRNRKSTVNYSKNNYSVSYTTLFFWHPYAENPVIQTKTHGFRTFSCFGPHIWNSLP